jgi:precorrin-6A/cobalt-precorrin-6A reductase
VLILGGTGEARALAAALVGDDAELAFADTAQRGPSEAGTPPGAGPADTSGIRVISSLAGRVAQPRLPVGEVRIGGFGGPEKLAEWLRDERIAAVVDATHPFAERISSSAAEACGVAGVPLLRLQRPGWSERPGDTWHWVDDLDQAADLLPTLGRRVLLTTGRQGLAAFRATTHAWFLIRCVDPPDPADLPPSHELLLDRGPYTLAGERQLIYDHAIDVVATKDSGGELTVAKLDAAREHGLPVVVVRRPAGPEAETVETVDAALAWTAAQLA